MGVNMRFCLQRRKVEKFSAEGKLVKGIKIGVFMLMMGPASAAPISTDQQTDDIAAIQQIIIQAKSLGASADGYGPAGTDLTPKLMKAGRIPTSMRTSNANGGFKLPIGDARMTATSKGDYASITLAPLTIEQCLTFAKLSLGDAVPSIKINSNAPISFPTSINEIGQQCNQPENTITYYITN
jgi:hypothetical protein